MTGQDGRAKFSVCFQGIWLTALHKTEIFLTTGVRTSSENDILVSAVIIRRLKYARKVTSQLCKWYYFKYQFELTPELVPHLLLPASRTSILTLLLLLLPRVASSAFQILFTITILEWIWRPHSNWIYKIIRKVAGWSPAEDIEILLTLNNPSSHSMDVGLAQPLTEMRNRNK
jgi:hypothetical protein